MWPIYGRLPWSVTLFFRRYGGANVDVVRIFRALPYLPYFFSISPTKAHNQMSQRVGVESVVSMADRSKSRATSGFAAAILFEIHYGTATVNHGPRPALDRWRVHK